MCVFACLRERGRERRRDEEKGGERERVSESSEMKENLVHKQELKCLVEVEVQKF